MRVDILNKSEVQAVADRLAGDDLILWLLGTSTGLRISDILAINVGTIQGKSRLSIRERKTGKSRRIYISQDIRDMISRYIDRHNLQPQDKLCPLSYVSYYRHIVAAAKGVTDKHIGTHTMRKSYAYNRLTDKGYDLYTLQHCLNHSHITDTINYTIPNAQYRRRCSGRKGGKNAV